MSLLLKLGSFALFALSYYFLSSDYQTTDTLFVIACACAIGFNLRHPNILTWVGIIMLMRLVEVIFFAYFFQYTRSLPILHYSIQCALDIAVIMLITKRWYLYYKYVPGAREEDAYFTNADFMLIIIYVLYFTIGLLAMVESIIRRPDRIFLPADWGYPDVLFIYNNFEQLKAGISILLFAALWGSISAYFKKSGKFLSA